MFTTFRSVSIPALISFSLITGCGGGRSDNGSAGSGGQDSSPTSVTLTFYDGVPAVAAAKIGSGTYAIQSVNSNKLTLSIPSGTTNFSVAYVCGLYEDVFEASTVGWELVYGALPSPVFRAADRSSDGKR